MGRPDRQVREQIVAAAVKLLREEGIKAVAQPQVCKAAGVPQGHLTYYFPRKIDLLAAVGRRTLEEAVAEMQRFLGGESWRNAGDDARARLSAIAAHLIENRERTRMLLGILVEADRDPGLRAQLVQGVSMVRGVLSGLFGRPIGDPDVDLLIATLWGLGIQELVLEGRRTPAETAALIARVPRLFGLADAPTASRRAHPRSSAKPRRARKGRRP